jgi:hypothetical protein
MAQDFGKNWIDRVTHELIEDDTQLSPHPATWNFTAGELYSYDSNIFLTHTGRTNDSIFTTFVGGDVKYAQPNFDAEADLLVNYNAYASTDNVNADEERFFGRVRYQGTQIILSLAEIARRESSPTDAVFTTRVPRFLSNTTPLVVFKPSEVFAFEVSSDLQYLDYLRTAYSVADNFNSRTLLTLAYTTNWNNMDLLVQGGYWEVTYRDPASPPDAGGFIGRVGVRGEVSPKLHLVALVGITSADSNDFVGTNQDVQLNTADVEIHIAYTPNENTTWYADYSRRFGFSADGAPFQVVNIADLIGEWGLREDFKLRSRLEYSRVQVPSPAGFRRAYYAFGIGAEYKIHPHILLDGSLTYRWGVVPGSGSTGDFGDGIISIGAAILF